MPSLISSLYEFGEFRLDAQNRTLRRGVEPIPLTPKAFEVLLLLIQHSGQVVTKDELMKAVWADSFVEESNLTQTVFMLRKSLGESLDQRYILTLQGRGYRFAAEVKEVPQNGRLKDKARETPSISLNTSTLNAQPLSVESPLRSKRSWLLIAGAVTVALVAILGIYVRWSGSRAQAKAPGARVMLAVLPFQNLTGDSTQDYFSDGLTEEMITQIGNLNPQRLGVIARTSVMRYKNSATPLDQVGHDLGVQYVIEGSVRRDADKVRVTAQLIQTKDQTHIWARQYDRELKGLLTLQSEIAQEIADEIQLTLSDRKSGPTQNALSPQNYEAYDLYLKGQYFFNKRTVAGLQEAIRYFQQATVKDPNFARAYAGLADSCALMPGYSGLPPNQFMNPARAAAMKALALDERLPEAHTALALIVQNYDWDWETSEKEFRRAIELNPNYATAHQWYAEHLMWRGRFDEALQESERARQLDPLSLIIAADNGAIWYFSRRYDRAIEKWHSVLEMEPDFPRAGLIAVAYAEKGMSAEALAVIEKRRPTDSAPPWWYWSLKAYIYARTGQRAQAHHALDELLQLNRRSPIDSRILAWNYAALGDKEQALAFLEKAYVQHSTELITLKVNPAYDSLRGDPRFQDLLRRVGLGE